MATNYAHCKHCDMEFSFIDEPICHRCKTRVHLKGGYISQDFGIGDKMYRITFYYESAKEAEDRAGYLLTQALTCLVAFKQGNLTIEEVESE